MRKMLFAAIMISAFCASGLVSAQQVAKVSTASLTTYVGVWTWRTDGHGDIRMTIKKFNADGTVEGVWLVVRKDRPTVFGAGADVRMQGNVMVIKFKGGSNYAHVRLNNGSATGTFYVNGGRYKLPITFSR